MFRLRSILLLAAAIVAMVVYIPPRAQADTSQHLQTVSSSSVHNDATLQVQQVTAGQYSCGVDMPDINQCARTVSKNPIDCASNVNPQTGAVTYACKERKKKQVEPAVIHQQELPTRIPDQSALRAAA
jgi:hypothetical protein